MNKPVRNLLVAAVRLLAWIATKIQAKANGGSKVARINGRRDYWEKRRIPPADKFPAHPEYE